MNDTAPADVIATARPRPRWALHAGVFILGFIGGAIILAGVLYVQAFGWPRWQHGFDSEEWNAAAGAPFVNDDRWFMIDDLLHGHTLKGLDQIQLEALLGPPDPQPYLLHEQPRHAGSHIYRLGPDHLGVDSMWLVVTWDATKHVADAIVVSD